MSVALSGKNKHLANSGSSASHIVTYLRYGAIELFDGCMPPIISSRFPKPLGFVTQHYRMIRFRHQENEQ